MVHYTANCISRLDFLPRDEEWPGALLHLHAVHIYVRHVLWLQCMHICSEPLVRHYTPTRRRLQSKPAEDVEIHGRRCVGGRADQPFQAGGQRVQAAGFILQDEVLAIVC